MISIDKLSYSYSPQTSIQFPDVMIPAGQHALLLGESGSGKTTLLHLMGGLLRQYSGSIKLDGIELSSLSEKQLDHFRGQKIGFIFQRNHLVSALTVEQNLMLAPYLADVAIDKNRIAEVLESLGLSAKRHSKVTALSHGQAQRAAIARAVLNKPALILADEPTSALDDKNCDRVIHLLMEVASANNSTLVVATHDQRVKEKISLKFNV